MTSEDAAIIMQARELLEQRHEIERQFSRARSHEHRRQLWAQRRSVVAAICKMPTWALEIASGNHLDHALGLARRNADNPGAQRLIRWAESRYT